MRCNNFLSRVPQISVVMGVRNGGQNLEKTINSILNQDEVDLELIIVNDGSTDDTEEVLRRFKSSDSRIICVSQKPNGLTASLITGCNLARGEFIARQDADDISLPNRLRQQARLLAENTNASMCSTFVRFVTKEGVLAYICKTGLEEKAIGLTGTIHGSVMMRKSMYSLVGGYRNDFYYAQDVDLWSRLVEVGNHIVIPHIYYESLLYPSSISGTKTSEQRKFFFLIQETTKARRSGRSEKIWLKRASEFSEECKLLRKNSKKEACGAYFIGACLLKSHPNVAAKYFTKAIQLDPTHLRARLKLAILK